MDALNTSYLEDTYRMKLALETEIGFDKYLTGNLKKLYTDTLTKAPAETVETANAIIVQAANFSDYLVEDYIRLFKVIDRIMEQPISSYTNPKTLFRYAMIFDNSIMLEAFIEYGMSFADDVSPVKTALFEGKLKSAKLLIDKGYPLPTQITVFNINHQLHWKYDRLKFVIDNNIPLEISEEEELCIKLLYNTLSNRK